MQNSEWTHIVASVWKSCEGFALLGRTHLLGAVVNTVVRGIMVRDVSGRYTAFGLLSLKIPDSLFSIGRLRKVVFTHSCKLASLHRRSQLPLSPRDSVPAEVTALSV
jgi:hypothetical protein